jgi:hypothetical protein
VKGGGGGERENGPLVEERAPHLEGLGDDVVVEADVVAAVAAAVHARADQLRRHQHHHNQHPSTDQSATADRNTNQNPANKR